MTLRRNAYQEYLSLILRLGAVRTHDDKNEKEQVDCLVRLQEAIARITIVASSRVVPALAAFEAQRTTAFSDGGKTTKDLLQAMREDVFDADDVALDALLAVFPISSEVPK